MPSDSTPAVAKADESLPYGVAKGMLEGINTALAKRDPKEQRARSKNSPGGRRKVNFLRTVSKGELLKELLRREAIEQRRINGRERKSRWRTRQELKKAVAAAKARGDLN